jgi:1-acyl-sn-glycerol-3-phosphate acyltransferase
MNGFTRLAEIAWGLYVLVCFAIACIFSLFVAILVPGPERRQLLVTWASKMVFVLGRASVTIRGIDNLPADSCVVVANHASYIDGVLLKGYLPPRFGFVIKGEMRAIPIVSFLLRRSGAKFVDRNEGAKSSTDARQLVRAAQDGESLGFFPEGTFWREPGIRHFRAGAFLVAIKGSLPTVPIAISGTRQMLPSGNWIPRRADLLIDILPVIAPGDDDFANSRQLAETVRRQVIIATGEPGID